MKADPLRQSPAHSTSKGRQAHCIIPAASAPDRWMIYAQSQKNRRACRGDSMSEAVARQMLSVGLRGLAGSSQFRCNLDTLSAEPPLPRFQHSDVPFAILYARYPVNKLSAAGEHRTQACPPSVYRREGHVPLRERKPVCRQMFIPGQG